MTSSCILIAFIWRARSGRARLLRTVRRPLRPRDARRAGRRARSRVPGRARGPGVSSTSSQRCCGTTSDGRRRSTTRGGCQPSLGGARIFLKREDLAHTGAHKINNALGQALLAKRMGKRRVIAETGAGQHGVATATACALLGLECDVYMGADDMERQALNVFRMRAARRDRAQRRRRQPHAEGRDQRGDARLGRQRRRQLLPARLGARAASVSADGARVPVGHRPGGPTRRCSSCSAGCPTSSSPASAAAATPWASSTRSSTTRACG